MQIARKARTISITLIHPKDHRTAYREACSIKVPTVADRPRVLCPHPVSSLSETSVSIKFIS